ncbi:MAG TPA: DUF4397 domain-containing protein [Jiangellaceae bacterium]|nr:DUF4397 domain-containing protein [Jiangellaceae bacterium]
MIRSAVRSAFLTVTLLAAFAAVTPPAQAAPAQGWIRLAHLSPDTPEVDVYLSSFGDADDPTVLRGVGYGMFSPYQRVPEGSYTVAMRLAGAPSTEPAVLSTTVQVGSDAAATVAGMGQNSELRLVTLTDDLDAPAAGQSKLRVIQAAMTAPEVDTVTLGDTALASDFEFTAATDYRGVPAGSAVVRVDAPGSTAEQTVELAAGSTYTVVVRDLAGGLGVLSIQDFAATGQTPTGGVDAGLGGSVMAPSTASWTVAGVTVVAAWFGGLLIMRRRRPRGR